MATQWEIFREAATYNNITDFQEYSVSVIDYINTYIDDVTMVKTIKKQANQKPYMEMIVLC